MFPLRTAQAERRDGVLIRLSVTSGHSGDDLPTIAGTLHVLDDHQLWSYLNTPLSPSWLLT
ncbi:hypothetical protein ACFRDV_20105 [Streptomyces fagopyri]|uniref:hypothetical protein n=1 Tax=Streptomyces fagopyri TaxID=2662397 RepID=UPI0036CFC901